MVPTILVFLAKHPMVSDYDISCVRLVAVGAAPIGRDISETLLQRHPYIKFLCQGRTLSSAGLFSSCRTNHVITIQWHIARGGGWQGGGGGWGYARNPGAAAPKECSLGLRPQNPAGAPPQILLGAPAPRLPHERALGRSLTGFGTEPQRGLGRSPNSLLS